MSKRILVVDDSNLMRHRIIQCLTNAGYEIVGKAKDGDEAVELYRALKPEVVTMDVTMRGKDGITAAKEILTFDPKAAIILYTLLDTQNLAIDTNEVTIKKIIRKGDEDELLQTLASLS